jgi:hypothetical protein
MFTTLAILIPNAQRSPAAPIVFISSSDRVLRLDDRNNDDDYLDPFESSTFAMPDSTTAGRISATSHCVWMVESGTNRILCLEDRNGDNDALDSAEQRIYAVAAQQPTMALPALHGIAIGTDESLFVTDTANGVVYCLHDRNGDGDALDANEVLIVATGLSSPTSLAARSDGSVLVLDNSPVSPIRILIDRNSDGDFLDFAENLIYAESLAHTVDLCGSIGTAAWTTNSADDTVLILTDENGDGDVLDPYEIRQYAVGLTAPTRIASDTLSNDLFVTVADSVIRLRDINRDGDALDFGEMQRVADAIPQINGIAVGRPSTMCLVGDANGDGRMDVEDIAAFAAALTDASDQTICPIDMNADHRVDGQDVQPFIEQLAR